MTLHGGGAYISEQTVMRSEDDMPGLVCYVRDKRKILRRSSVVFGPGDLYCSIWHVLSLAGIGAEDCAPAGFLRGHMLPSTLRVGQPHFA
jgi:hypothetical protein